MELEFWKGYSAGNGYTDSCGFGHSKGSFWGTADGGGDTCGDTDGIG